MVRGLALALVGLCPLWACAADWVAPVTAAGLELAVVTGIAFLIPMVLKIIRLFKSAL